MVFTHWPRPIPFQNQVVRRESFNGCQWHIVPLPSVRNGFPTNASLTSIVSFLEKFSVSVRVDEPGVNSFLVGTKIHCVSRCKLIRDGIFSLIQMSGFIFLWCLQFGSRLSSFQSNSSNIYFDNISTSIFERKSYFANIHGVFSIISRTSDRTCVPRYREPVLSGGSLGQSAKILEITSSYRFQSSQETRNGSTDWQITVICVKF